MLFFLVDEHEKSSIPLMRNTHNVENFEIVIELVFIEFSKLKLIYISLTRNLNL